MENLTTTPEDAVGIAGFLLSGDQKVFTCRGCGSEYLAESPATGCCPICPLVAELAAVRDEVERVQAYRVIEAPSLEDLEVALNSNAAAGYRAVRVDPPFPAATAMAPSPATWPSLPSWITTATITSLCWSGVMHFKSASSPPA